MSAALLLSALLAAQAGPARPAARAATPPAAAATLATPTDWPPVSLFTDDDYPAGALRGEHQGLVRFRLEIGTDGRVSGCTIRRSSGSSSLDERTCRILRSRARFVPARDSEGHAVPDTRDGEVTWRLPPDG